MTDEKAREVLQKLIDKCAQEGDAKGIIALSHAIKSLGRQPKQGHWKLVQRGKNIDICCSNCKAVRVKEYAYNYTIDELNKSEDFKEFLKHSDMNYCPDCSADMRGDSE